MGVPTAATIEKKFEGLDNEIKESFKHFPKLFREFPLDVSIIYLFAQIELAQVNAIYCGAAKLHRVNHEVARTAVENWHMSRNGFKEMYKTIFEHKLSESIAARLSHAEKTRDKIVHGRRPKNGSMRQAVFDILEFATEFSQQVNSDGGFTPFGSLRGFKGRGKSLDKAPSRWMLKGMGFNI